MNWIMTLKSSRHVTVAVIHFNQAIEDLGSGRSVFEVSRSLFDAMKKIQYVFNLATLKF